MIGSLSMKEPPLAIPSCLFRSGLPRHTDRYVIYHMLNHHVTFRDPDSGTKVTGYVEEVFRDVFAGEVRLKVRGHVFRFKEPAVIRADRHDIVFVYGDAPGKELTDARLFAEMRKRPFGEAIADTISRMTPRRSKEKRITVGDKRPMRKKPFLMRGIHADLSAFIGASLA